MATPKKRIKKRKIGTINMRTGEYTPVKPENEDPGKKSGWESLVELIQAYADAQEADSWKGGGDPEYIPVVEAELALARLKLNTHIEHMRRRYEECQ